MVSRFVAGALFALLSVNNVERNLKGCLLQALKAIESPVDADYTCLQQGQLKLKVVKGPWSLARQDYGRRSTAQVGQLAILGAIEL